jgi:thioredoxin-related protein
MKISLIILAATLSLFSVPWHYDLEEAKQIAQKEHRHILLNFSGSDWCGPCIRMRQEIFENQAFLQVADSLLVLVNADFPRMKKNQLSERQQQINNALADHYNPQGKFPFTILMNADGKVLESWDGFPTGGEQEFIYQLQSTLIKYP